MNERPFGFDGGRGPFGVLSLPHTLDPDRPLALIPNSGLIHRVGPNRLHVELARALAEAGVATLRFDVSGRGDSPCAAEPGAGPRDLAMAMDALHARGFCNRFVGIGFGSGADDVHQAALDDPRVVGAMFIDGYRYKTPRFWVNYGVDRLTRSKRHAGSLDRGERPRADGDPAALHDALPDEIEFFSPPPPAKMKSDLQAFIARNVALFFLYTGDLQADYNYREQLTDAFPLLRSYPRMTLHYLPDADHGFSRRTTRENLVRLLCEWVVNDSRSPQERPSESHR